MASDVVSGSSCGGRYRDLAKTLSHIPHPATIGTTHMPPTCHPDAPLVLSRIACHDDASEGGGGGGGSDAAGDRVFSSSGERTEALDTRGFLTSVRHIHGW